MGGIYTFVNRIFALLVYHGYILKNLQYTPQYIYIYFIYLFICSFIYLSFLSVIGLLRMLLVPFRNHAIVYEKMVTD